MIGYTVHQNKASLDGQDLEKIAEQFGTPLFVYAGDSIAHGINQLKQALGDGVQVYYSIKANPAIGLCKLIKNSGVDGAEIASSGELISAIASGFDPSKILFAGPGKTDGELACAIKQGITQINAESTGEIHRINQLAIQHKIVQRVGIRVNPEDTNAGQGKIKTAGGPQKFGIDESQALQAIKLIQTSKNIEFAGLHTMLGSQVLNANQMLASCQRSIQMAIRIGQSVGTQIQSLNFGGGLGVPHSDDDPKFDLAHFGSSLAEIIESARQYEPLKNTQFMIEPGRTIVSKHGLYLTRVIDTKQSAGQTFAIVDGGIHHALLPITANTYQITLVNQTNQTQTHPITLGGPLCTSADQWRPQIQLPLIKPGDLIAMHNSGAYGLTASMTMFLSKETPAEILIHNKKYSIIRERSTPKSVLNGQHIPEFLD